MMGAREAPPAESMGMMGEGTMRGGAAKAMQVCPKCNTEFPTQTEDEGEGAGPDQGVREFFEQNDPKMAMRGPMR
jgi:hypothetical protein